MVTKTTPLVFIAVLTLSTFALQAYEPVNGGQAYLKVTNPLTGDRWFNFTTDTTSVGDTFTINITVVDVTDLQNWMVKLTWDPSLLDFVSLLLPTDHVFSGAGRTIIQGPPMIDSGSVAWGATYINDPYWTFNGTGTCCQITLRITRGAGQRTPEVNCPLPLVDIGDNTFLIDGLFNDISFIPLDGFYDFKYVPQERVIRIVDAASGSTHITLGNPSETVPPEGYPFVVNVTLDGFTQDLFLYQIAIRFSRTGIICKGYSLPHDDPDFVFYNRAAFGPFGKIYNDPGYVVMGALIFEGAPPGSTTVSHGIFCQISFAAMAVGAFTMDFIPGPIIPVNTCYLDDTFLWDIDMHEIPFTPQGFSVSCGIGTVQPPPIHVGGKDYIVTAESNATLTDVTATRSSLHFKATGTEGSAGYVNATVPVGLNKTAIKVFINKVKLTPPPFPIVTTNGTHYFVYFEFSLSTHNVTIQYANADIVATNITQSKTVVGQGYSVQLDATMQNQGDYEETFNVTVFANDTSAASQTITLQNGSSTTVTFQWNTTGFAKGNYTVKVAADILQDETDTTDNTLIGGTIRIGVPCDVIGPPGYSGPPDDACNNRDIGYLCSKFLTTPSSLGWDPNCDITGPTYGVPDYVVNMRDIGEACNNFGKTDP